MIHWKNLGTQGRIDAIRAVWFPGCSTAQIASNFKEATRNAVIGVYQRYGKTHLADKPLNARSPINKAGIEKKKRRIYRAPANFKPEPGPDPVFVPTEYNLCGKPMMMLLAHECRFPVNDAARDEVHLFCARPTESSFCDHHISRVYRPKETRA